MIVLFYEHLEDLAAYAKNVGEPEIMLGRWTLTGQPTVMADYPRRAVLVASLLMVAPAVILRTCLLPVWKYLTDADGRVVNNVEGEDNQAVANRVESARRVVEKYLEAQDLEVGRAVPALPKDLELTYGTASILTFNKETKLYEASRDK